MRVRSFQLSDYVHLNKLLEDVLSETCYEETKEALANQLSWDSDLVLVAVVDDTIVGAIIGTIDGDNGYYYRLAVHADHRGKGIATTMIHALKDRFTSRKVNRILVNVDHHNEPILSVYEAAGCVARDFVRSLRRLSIVGG
jgi:ribosomal protein S18 acetylase RimI-like enzyme